MTGWQPIETAPKDGTNILAWWANPHAEPIIISWDGHNGEWSLWCFCVDGSTAATEEFSHWMPLPEPPSP